MIRHQLINPAAARLQISGFALLTMVAFSCALAGLTAAAAQAGEMVFDLKIENGRVAPNMRLIRVKEGTPVKLRWTSDRPITLHLHGYDIETRIEPGAVAEMAFVARATGRFPVEEHTPMRGHSHSEAPLVRIEVHPR